VKHDKTNEAVTSNSGSIGRNSCKFRVNFQPFEQTRNSCLKSWLTDVNDDLVPVKLAC
jgi:hypothetical protein